MTAILPWRCGGTGLVVGRKLKDCEDGLLLTVASVDSDGDYWVVDRLGNEEGVVLAYEAHDGSDHRICMEIDCEDFGRSATCCYEWVRPAD